MDFLGEGLYDWMKNLAVFYIFLAAVMNLAPEQCYREYLRLFMGLLLILIVLMPLLRLLQCEDLVSSLVDQYALALEQTEEKYGSLSERVQKDNLQEDYLLEAYVETVRQEVTETLVGLGYECVKVEAVLEGEEDLAVEQITVTLAETVSQEEEARIRDELGETYQVQREDVRIFSEESQ